MKGAITLFIAVATVGARVSYRLGSVICEW